MRVISDDGRGRQAPCCGQEMTPEVLHTIHLGRPSAEPSQIRIWKVLE